MADIPPLPAHQHDLRAQRVLRAIAHGHFLKSHRDVDGHKVYQLHALDGSTETIAWEIVEALQDQGLIASNQKFPAATYWLTDTGKATVADLER